VIAAVRKSKSNSWEGGLEVRPTSIPTTVLPSGGV